MCGRFTQISGLEEFIEELSSRLDVVDEFVKEPIARYNVPPQTQINLLRIEQGKLVVDSVKWGWKPHWAKDMQPTINARVEKVATSKFYTQIWTHKCLILANGWFEWVKEGSSKQPFYIYHKTNKPLFFAGLGNFKEESDNKGAVIITADTQGGMIDIHDRRPIVFEPEIANQWIVDELGSDQAKQLLINNARPSTDFNWHAVDKAVGNVKNQDSHLIDPIK